ncbi:MAG: hypothetical protein FWG55_05930 [Candidatus Bathyarchaeota archaeon]|nr:hypothetical protein [Candidatus Termiticorpusculum sp.]
MTKAAQNKALKMGPLELLFGGSAAKILDFLSTFQDLDYSKQDIAQNSGVSFRHTLREIERLEKLGFIARTRNVGHSHMYRYNKDYKAAKSLEKFASDLTFEEDKKIIANKQQQPNDSITIVTS